MFGYFIVIILIGRQDNLFAIPVKRHSNEDRGLGSNPRTGKIFVIVIFLVILLLLELCNSSVRPLPVGISILDPSLKRKEIKQADI